MADNKIIFTMTGVSKIIPPNKAILNNIYLSFYYGAKIGVLGLNGAGKSTLLKLIAGIDPNYNGHITFDKDYKIGYLEQEPTLDPDKTVLDIVKEGVKEVVDILAEYEAVNAKFAEEITDDEMRRNIMSRLFRINQFIKRRCAMHCTCTYIN